MPIVKIKVCDASAQPLAGLSVALSGCGDLQTNALGMVQFLAGDPAPSALTISGNVVWSGNLSELTRNEVFTQSGSGFVHSRAA